MRKGFSLLELSIVLIIVGILIGMGLEFAGPMLEQSKRNANRAKMNTIETALLTYLKTHGKMPCPARWDRAQSQSDFGAATTCTTDETGGSNGVKDVNTVAEDIRIGMVPTRELSISPSYAFDAYNNRITYAVIKKLAVDSTNYSDYAGGTYAQSVTDGVITIWGATDNIQITNASNKIIVPYVLVSHGKDGLGARNFSGGALVGNCDTSHKDGENCDQDQNFRETAYLDMAGANYNDDLIRWKTKDRMEVEAGKLSITTGTGSEFPTCAEGESLVRGASDWECEAPFLAEVIPGAQWQVTRNFASGTQQDNLDISAYTAEAKYVYLYSFCSSRENNTATGINMSGRGNSITVSFQPGSLMGTTLCNSFSGTSVNTNGSGTTHLLKIPKGTTGLAFYYNRPYETTAGDMVIGVQLMK